MDKDLREIKKVLETIANYGMVQLRLNKNILEELKKINREEQDGND